MDTQSLYAISPLDGRYKKTALTLSQHFSEAAVIEQRLKLEIIYLKFLSQEKIIRKLSKKEQKFLDSLTPLSKNAVARIKKIEEKTSHDIKAIEYYLQEKFNKNSLKDLIPYIHFALTSEDINNLALRSLIKKAQDNIIFPDLLNLLEILNLFVKNHKATPMLARTHGQGAVPSTFGKEIAVFAQRLLLQIEKIKNTKLTGKFSGAVGSYNSFAFADGKVNWVKFSKKFVEDLDLEHLFCSTQINPNDDLAELFSHYHRLNSILIDFSQDIWRYISDDWLSQKHQKNQVGSSTMPQKINPINFENAEGNLGLANSLFEFFMRKLPISRLQRDLSDSTVLRNIGVSLAHSQLAYQNLYKGLNKLEVNKKKMAYDLNNNWNILAEAINIDSRQQGDKKAYQRIMQKMKGNKINKDFWQKINQDKNSKLHRLSPEKYLGLSEKIAEKVSQKIIIFVKKSFPKRSII